MTPNIRLKSQGKTVFAPLSNAAWTPATRTLGIPTTTTRYPGTRIEIVHTLDNAIKVKTQLIMKEKHNRKYPNITEGDYVKIYDKGKGNYVSRKETKSKWSEKKYKVILVGRDMLNNRYYKSEGMSKRYNRHELLLVDD